MKVSIIVPIFKAEKHIAECAESLFAQTYRDIEFIFVDDNSPDNSISIVKNTLEKYPERKERVNILLNKRNLGSGGARNIALHAATGEAIMFADADDIMPCEAVEQLVNAFETDNADMVEGAYQTLTQKGLEVPILPKTTRTQKRYVDVILCQDVANHALWAKIYSRKLFTKHHIEFAKGVTNMEDYCLLAHLAPFIERRTTINDTVYIYRNDHSSFFNQVGQRDKVRSMIRANWAVRRFYQQNGLLEKHRIALRLGLINMIRKGRRVGLSMKLFRSKIPLPLYSLGYRLLRKLFISI